MEGKEKMEFLKYIKECDEVIASGNVGKAEELSDIIVSIFQNSIINIYDGLDSYSDSYDNNADHIKDIKLLRRKLEFFVNTKGKYSGKPVSDKSINVHAASNSSNSMNNSGNSTNTNTNINTVDIKAELTRVRDEIEANEYINSVEREEIIEKLDEIEDVIDESPTNNEKWDRLKGVVTWIGTKSYKIGEMIFPIILKSVFPDAQ